MPARLFQSTSLEEQWTQVVRPWLRERKQAWEQELPTVVLVTSRSEGFFWRSRVLAEKEGLLGVHFWTPSDARKFLLKRIPLTMTAATQTELRLLARLSAEQLEQETPAEVFLHGIRREPGDFLRGYDGLVSGGWDPCLDNVPENRDLVRKFRATLRRLALGTQAEIHRNLAQAETPLLLAPLLVLGFQASHWPIRDLLRALVRAAAEVTLSLTAPRVFAEKIDQLWISSWEAELGVTSEPTEASAEDGPFTFLVQDYERGSRSVAEEKISFLVARDLKTHATAITRQALAYLEQKDCTRLGIVFPEPDALALEVAERLHAQGIPLDEGTGFFAPTLFCVRSWSAWLVLQQEWSAPAFLTWIQALESEGKTPPLLSGRETADRLQGAWGETLVENLDFLAVYLEKKADQREKELARFLSTQTHLSPAGTFSAFLESTLAALDLWGNQKQGALLTHYAPRWPDEPVLSREAFLLWLREATAPRERQREKNGNHFYGKVHLLTYAQCPGQSWSHLILTQLNEHIWPPGRSLGQAEIWKALNQHARQLNQKTTVTGGQGEGHEIVAPGHNYGLTSQDKEDLSWRDLCAAVEETTHGLCLTASTSEAGQRLLPNDFFTQAYHRQSGDPLQDETWQALARRTTLWCGEKKTALIFFPAPHHAYLARREATSPFGPYEFSFSSPPARPIQLSCKAWEEALQFPAASWLRQVVGVVPPPETDLPWSRATGTWAHLWLAHALEKRQKGSRDWPRELRREQERFRATLQTTLASLAQELPTWWRLVWSQAVRSSAALAEALEPVLPGWEIRLEKKLPSDLFASLPGTEARHFQLRGKPDLVLEKEGLTWVIDFKTNPQASLKADTAGLGLQIILYALAMRQMGAGPVRMSLLAPNTELVPEKELSLDAIGFPLYRSLDLLHRAGIFGQRPSSDFAFTRPLPLTTLEPEAEILDAKWEFLRGETIAEEEA